MTNAPRPFAIFDIDGTLVDSRFIINASMQACFKAAGLAAPSYEQTRQIVGLSLDVAIDRLAPRALSADDLADLVEGYKRAFIDLRQNQDNHEPLYDGAQALLESLKSEGWHLGVATGKSRRGLDAVIKRQRWAPLFDCHFCADDGPGKPHPHMIHANLEAVGADPALTVMIGDTSFDMMMSKSAGITAYGVNWGFHTPAEIKAGGADAIFSSMDELSAALSKFKTETAAMSLHDE